MVKFCLQCKNAFWGGDVCPKCEGDIPLLDAALPENKKYLSELNVDVRPKYFARSSMLLSCFGFVMALPVGMFIYIRGMSVSQNIPLWISVSLVFIIGVSWGTWKLSHKLFDKQMEDVHEEAKEKEPQLD